MFTKTLIVLKLILAATPIILGRLTQAIRAKIHHYTYKSVSDPINIVVIGGSFGGYFLATDLANSLPTGYRVVLIEKKSHFNFTWLFPRISVVSEHEHKAFIPYGPRFASLPKGSLIFKQATATAINETTVTLQDGTVIQYEYLALATGSTGRPPWHLESGEKRDGMKVFCSMQKEVQAARDIVVLGGGAVGVELAADVKDMYSEKSVSLIHSRATLLNSFGPKLHAHALQRLQDLGVNVFLEERPSADSQDAPSIVEFKDGSTIPFDLLIKCTGQTPASQILASLSPSSISNSGSVLVKETLQILDPRHPHIFALGDVAETQGVRMGRAAMMQGIIVTENILRLIKGKALRNYKPIGLLEDGIDLTLGLTKGAQYFKVGDVEFLTPKNKTIDLDARNAWRLNGAKGFEDIDYDVKSG